LDQAVFGNQGADTAYARIPNGTGDFVQQAPTFNENNETVSATHDLAHRDIQLYPNPVQDEMMIKVNDEGVGKEYFISDMMGRILTSGTLSQPLNPIDLSALASGQYLFVIGDKQQVPVKVIKL
jgi:hypothetical protein